MDHRLGRTVSFLLMILTCLWKKYMALNLQLSCLDSGWTMAVGTISTSLKGTSEPLKKSALLLQWAHLVAVEIALPTDTYATSISFMLNHTQIDHSTTSSATSWSGCTEVKLNYHSVLILKSWRKTSQVQQFKFTMMYRKSSDQHQLNLIILSIFVT